MITIPVLKRLSKPERPLTTGDMLILSIVVLILTAVVVVGLFTIVSSIGMPEAASARWSAWGTWFAGGATAASVAAAVWFGNRQTKQSRDAVQKQLGQAEDQHKAQIAELREQLQTTVRLHDLQLAHDAAQNQRELQYGLRARQLDAIASLWTAIGQVVGPTTELVIRIERIFSLTEKVKAGESEGGRQPSTAEADDVGDIVSEVARRREQLAEELAQRRMDFSEWMTSYQDTIVQAQIAFTSTHLWITDLRLRASMFELEKSFEIMAHVANSVFAAYGIGVEHARLALGPLEESKASLLKSRGPMIKLAVELLDPSSFLHPDQGSADQAREATDNYLRHFPFGNSPLMTHRSRVRD